MKSTGLIQHPRMLLYLCNMWLKDRKVFEWTPEEFWTEIFSYMRLTNDQKYPEKQMTKEEQERIIGKIKEFVRTNQDRSRDNFDKFFDEEGADLFYFGVFSLQTEEGKKIDEGERETVFLPYESPFLAAEDGLSIFSIFLYGFFTIGSIFIIFVIIANIK